MCFKIKAVSLIKQQVIKNLLSAHKRIADNGSVTDLIKLSKFILRLSKVCDDEVFDFGFENGNGCTGSVINYERAR